VVKEILDFKVLKVLKVLEVHKDFKELKDPKVVLNYHQVLRVPKVLQGHPGRLIEE
jgi:hypothetical protein